MLSSWGRRSIGSGPKFRADIGPDRRAKSTTADASHSASARALRPVDDPGHAAAQIAATESSAMSSRVGSEKLRRILASTLGSQFDLEGRLR
jgi:hypothetical protein